MVRYSVTPGPTTVAVAVADWPANATTRAHFGRPTLVLALHPQCPCSRATVTELARVTARSGNLTAVFVLCDVPADGDPAWDRTPLLDAVRQIPGVQLVRDPNGEEAARFGTLTSGEMILYSADGRTLFRGGITQARGHEGKCDAQDALSAAILDGTPASRTFPAYGCPIRG